MRPKSFGSGVTENVTSPSIDWEKVLLESEPQIRSVIHRYGARSAEEIDDIFQNVCQIAIGHREPVQNPAAWLSGVAAKQAQNYCRSQGRYNKYVGIFRQDFSSGGRSDEPDPVEFLLQEERHRFVREAKGRLSSGDQEILSLSFEKGLSYKQIAEKLGISVDAVTSRLHRARRALKRELEQYGQQ